MRTPSETTVITSAWNHYSVLVLVVWLAWLTPSWRAAAADDYTNDDTTAATRQQRSLRKLDVAGLANIWNVVPGVLSGEQPHGEPAFAALAKLGVATIVSVDGARPAIELARPHGMRYVHIPIGYDGLSEASVAALARVARECERPIYVHCHHGRHRGPTAAVVLAMSERNSDFKVSDAVDAMQTIGTGREYCGLWRAVREYQPPNGGALSESLQLPEVAEVDDLPAAMARLDRAWDRVVSCQQVNWQSPPDHPDTLPPHEALLLFEAFTESRRTVSPERDDKSHADLRDGLDRAVILSGSLRRAIAAGDDDEADLLIDRLRGLCRRCHEDSRN